MVIWNPGMCSQQRSWARNKNTHLIYCLKEIWRSRVKLCFHLEHLQPCVLVITASSLTELPVPSSGLCVDQKMSNPVLRPFPKFPQVLDYQGWLSHSLIIKTLEVHSSLLPWDNDVKVSCHLCGLCSKSLHASIINSRCVGMGCFDGDLVQNWWQERTPGRTRWTPKEDENFSWQSTGDGISRETDQHGVFVGLRIIPSRSISSWDGIDGPLVALSEGVYTTPTTSQGDT